MHRNRPTTRVSGTRYILQKSPPDAGEDDVQDHPYDRCNRIRLRNVTCKPKNSRQPSPPVHPGPSTPVSRDLRSGQALRLRSGQALRLRSQETYAQGERIIPPPVRPERSGAKSKDPSTLRPFDPSTLRPFDPSTSSGLRAQGSGLRAQGSGLRTGPSTEA